ncbi:hypothetical protein RND71_038894 [Anisodus tanguticus]|uniref:Uncharacterized protein n=1 Tax=Anisodus tanguticus TaxID=243964 RepID=A0AAE1R0Z9_9SOLA|nr:hypothetical protein RND71_038894 [Anisodus tanguticus]
MDEIVNRGNKASINEHSCLNWLDSMKPRSVIYASFSSLCHISSSQIKEIGLSLESSNVPFIWIIRGLNVSLTVEKWLSDENFEEKVYASFCGDGDGDGATSNNFLENREEITL